MGATDTALAPQTLPPPRLAEGTELIGQYRDSGFTESRYLACRGDGQVVQLSRLVYVLATLVDGRRELDELAQVFGAEIDRTVTAEQVEFLLDHKLRPHGLVVPGAVPTAPAPIRPDPLLMLKHRARLVPERIVWAIAGFFRPLFAPRVITAALAAFVLVDALVAALVLAGGGSAQILGAVRAFGAQPTLTLPVLAVLLVVGAFHECGHAAACRYGGARPAAMGIGLYLVWPAFYSTVTDAYRLNRAGRLRVDLGGVYFNAVSMTVIGMVYLLTGSPWLLVALVVLHVETMWQFLPSVRLDGYYILADLVGVPDLFARLGPILRSAPPWRETHPRVAELRPSVRRIVTLWVATTILFLGFWLVALVLLAPGILPIVWAALWGHIETIAAAAAAAHVADAALGAVQLILLVLPWAGVALIMADFGHRLCHAIRTRCAP